MYGRRPEARDWVWKSSRRWPPSGWRVRCSLMPAAMLEIHGAALRVLWGLLEANPLRRCARRRRWAPSTIDYTHHDQKKDRARQPPATLAPSHPKPLHAGNSQAPACGAPASRQRESDLRPGQAHKCEWEPKKQEQGQEQEQKQKQKQAQEGKCEWGWESESVWPH